jgi:hypothetical protein
MNDKNGYEVRKCAAMICITRAILPSGRGIELPSNVAVVDAKTVWYEREERILEDGTVIPQKTWPDAGEIMLIKNTAYRSCDVTADIWDEHADNRDNRPGWLCRWHAGTEEQAPITITLVQLEEEALYPKRECGDDSL